MPETPRESDRDASISFDSVQFDELGRAPVGRVSLERDRFPALPATARDASQHSVHRAARSEFAQEFPERL